MNETTTQTFQKHLFFRLFSLKNPKLAQKIQISEIDPPLPPYYYSPESTVNLFIGFDSYFSSKTIVLD